jgi:Protein of unknown function (DUF3619)
VNTQNDQELAKKITALLDRGNNDLRQGTVYKLQLARQAALAKMAGRSDSPQTATVHGLATAGGTGTIGSMRRLVTDFRLWLAVLIIAGGSYFYDYWTILQQASEIAELDSALLGSDLPVDAFLDKGFENWLKRSGE